LSARPFGPDSFGGILKKLRGPLTSVLFYIPGWVSIKCGRLDEHGCKICSHIHREEIERDFMSWKSPALIAKNYGLKDRSSVYRHAHALGLFPRRRRNVRAALE
jgi:hypothetical protein